MGTWGTAIFSDDVAEDIRYEYKLLIAYNYSDENATKIVKDLFYKEYNPKTDEDDEQVFWMALALTKWNCGRLDEETKAKALEILNNGGDLSRWKCEGKSLYNKRKRVLDELKEKLQSPQPAIKKVAKPPDRRSPWKLGDLLAFKIVYEKLIDSPLYGKYVLLRVSEIRRVPVCHFKKDLDYYEDCYVSLYNWVGDEIPDKSIVSNLEFVNFNPKIIPEFNADKLLWESSKERKAHITVIDNDPKFKGYDNILCCAGSYPTPAFTLKIARIFKDYKL